MSNDCDEYGPALPPGLHKEPCEEHASLESTFVDCSDTVIGLVLPPKGPSLQQLGKRSADSNDEEKSIGPILPHKLIKQQYKNSKTSQIQETLDDSDHGLIGPILPPHLLAHRQSEDDEEESLSSKNASCVIGPVLPPHFVIRKNRTDTASDSDGEEQMYGPSAPVDFSVESVRIPSLIGPSLPPSKAGGSIESSWSENDEGIVGPLPCQMFTGKESDYVAASLEMRARKMKDKLTNKGIEDPKPKLREAWMTELPPERGLQIGLTARTFSRRSKPATNDRSVWTDTPADRVRKEKERAGGGGEPLTTVQVPSTSNRDTKYSEEVNEYNKSARPESLLDIYQKKLEKKKKKEKEKPKERRPFDREQDLQVNRFDNAQRKALVKKSQGFNSRFEHGQTTSHFL